MVASLYVDEETVALGSRALARQKLADISTGKTIALEQPPPAAADPVSRSLADTPLLSEQERRAMMAAADVTGHGLGEVLRP